MPPRKSTRVANATAANAKMATAVKAAPTRAASAKATAQATKATKAAPKKPVKKAAANTRAKRVASAAVETADESSDDAPATSTPARNMKAATGTRRGRNAQTPKAAAVPAAKPPAKRKARSPSVAAPAPKRAKEAAVARRADWPPEREKKTIVNKPRYTDPLNVFVFGEGSVGELGLGATRKAKDVKRPRLNPALTDLKVVKVAAGGMHCLALTADNKIITWGVNDNGALGRDTVFEGMAMKDAVGDDDEDEDDETGGLNPREATPTAISSEHFPKNTVFVDVVAGDSASFALTDDGYVYGWGTFRKNEGILGFSKQHETARTPVWIPQLKNITKIACGSNHVLVLDTSKKVFAWGNGQQNQLGRRLTERALRDALLPAPVTFADRSRRKASKWIADIACGEYHSFAIGIDGYVWSWGVNNYGETGHPEGAGLSGATVINPKVIAALENTQIKSIKGGAHHNIAVTGNEQCMVWGRCDGCQLGMSVNDLNPENCLKDKNGRVKVLTVPTVVPSLRDIAFATCGPEHSIALTTGGKAFSWGFSVNYQTGLGTLDDVEQPTAIENTAVRDRRLVSAGCGGQYSLVTALANDGA